MIELKCPLCGSNSFYTKDPRDPYEVYEFDLSDGKIVFTSEVDESDLPEVDQETETYCNRCAWHAKLKTLG
jgi:coenzyme F420-reducing hydrogenase beta subunit